VSALPPLQKPLTEKAETSFTLPSKYYLDAEIFELEKQQIFYKNWQYVAHQSMLADAGDYVTIKICDENIFVIRSADGQLRAFYNICRHRAHELLTGSGNVRKLIVCPYHAWSYDTAGSLKVARMGEHRPGFDKAEFGLREIKLEILCGCIFVNLDDNCQSLSELAVGLEQDIRQNLPYLDEVSLAGTDLLGETKMDAGWKVVVDNYVECYHCRPAHKDFASIVDMDHYQVDIHPYWSAQRGPEIRLQNSAYEINKDSAMQQTIFWYLWPNTTFNVMPGSEELAVFAVRPIDAGSSTFGGHSLVVGGEVYQPRADYVSNILAPEDIHLCESVQRGLNSKSYDQGTFMVDPENCGESEYALHHFHRLVQQALSIDPASD
jgi:phenylpropionate dioxygenase-like ring-hydroxylating dioxygenase large terminal subunit